MAQLKARSYSFTLHALLVMMALLVAGLARENRQLKQAMKPLEPLAAGAEAPAIAARDLSGQEETLELDAASQETLLLVFTTTCPACRDNQAAWRALTQANQDRFQIVGVSLEDLETTASYREAEALPYRVLLPADNDRFSADYGINQIPLTFHIGRDGKVRDVWPGVLSDAVLAQFEATSWASLAP